MWLLTRNSVSPRIILSLIPIPIGVLMSTAGDLSFTLQGFLTALFSVIVTSARSVLFKKASSKKSKSSLPTTFEAVERYLQLGSLSFVFSFLILLLYSSPSSQSRSVFSTITAKLEYVFLVNQNIEIRQTLFYAGLYHFLYNLFSFEVLSQVSSALTHSLLNVLKRVVTILYSMLYFKNDI
ncbi:Aminopeptidase 2 mitochondrial, partial [Nowakowskiella sp. JEL0078]